MSTTTDFPRWIMGGPGERSTAIVPTLLREVAPNLYVGSENATDFMPVTWGTHGALLDDVVRFVSQWRAKGGAR